MTKSVAYQYDALGRRIGKSVDDNGNGTVNRRESYIYDGAGLLASAAGSIHISGPNGVMGQHGWVDQMVLSFVDPDGDSSSPSQLASRNLYGDAVDQIFATESGSGDVFWALTDHQGTPRDWATRSASGTTTIAQHTRYTAFGAIESVTGSLPSTLAPLPSFTGQLHDPDTDLLYYRARWYDPQLGKFLSDDPMGFEAGDANVSRYVGNAVPYAVDITGLDMGITGGDDHTGIWVDYWRDGKKVAVFHVDFGADGFMQDDTHNQRHVWDNLVTGTVGEFNLGWTEKPPSSPRTIPGTEEDDMRLVRHIEVLVFGKKGAIDAIYDEGRKAAMRRDALDDGPYDRYRVGGCNCHHFTAECVEEYTQRDIYDHTVFRYGTDIFHFWDHRDDKTPPRPDDDYFPDGTIIRPDGGIAILKPQP